MPSWGDEEYQAMQDVIASGMFTMGKHVAEFEKRFASHFGSRHAVMVNSGSSANLLMVAALFYTNQAHLRLRRGDVIVVPAVSWATTYSPLQQYGLKMRFVDIDRHTLNYDVEQLQAAMSDGKVKAIMAVNLLGNCNDFDKIRSLADRAGAVLIEDNCESMGAKFNGKQAGTFGAMGTFSCFFSHHMSTMEGGMIITDDPELAEILTCLRAHGWTRNLPKQSLVCGTKSDDPFEESFRFVLPGYNVRPLELSGAIGIQQLSKIEAFVDQRRSNAALFTDAMSRLPHLEMQKEVGQSSWFGFSVNAKQGLGIERKTLIDALAGAGFEVRPIVSGNFARKEVVKHFDHEIVGSLENADFIDVNGLFIGNHHVEMSEAIAAFEHAMSKLL